MATEHRRSIKEIIGNLVGLGITVVALAYCSNQGSQPDTAQKEPTPIISPTIQQFISENPICCFIPTTGIGAISMFLIKNRKYLKGRDL